MIDDLVRDLIRRQEAQRPRTQQTAIGPSDLSSPCDRKLVHQILGTPPVTQSDVSLQAWVGTAIHASLERAAEGDDDWLTEVPVGVKISDELTIRGTLDAYHKPTCSIIDYKSTGPAAHAKYKRKSPDNYLTQISLYGLMAVLSGRMQVKQTALVYIPRNSDLSEIHVDTHPWDQDRADAAIARLQHLHAAAAAGPVVLPLVGTADDCRFCRWWMPGSDRPQVGCPGHNPPDSTGHPAAWEPQEEEEAAAS